MFRRLTVSAIATVPLALQGCGSGDVNSTSTVQLTLAQMCTTQAMQRVMPSGTVVKDIPNLLTYLPAKLRATSGGVNLLAENALGDGAPSYCLVTGSYVTNATTGKTANFAAVLPAPDKWNGKYLQIGCGGTCGSVFDAGTPEPAHVRAGFAIWQTDDGHVDGSIAAAGMSLEADSSWAVTADNAPNSDAIQDYLHRAVHSLAVMGQQATASVYQSQRVKRSYFLGCSDGGREAMVEATKYPADFDGIVAGAPYNMRESNLNFMTRALVQLRGASAQLSAGQIKMVGNAMTTACDAADGTVDGLVQNPNACNFNPRRDIPQCAAGSAPSDSCLTSDQIDSVSAITSAARDETGAVVAAGFPATTLAAGMAASQMIFPTSPAAGPDPFGPQPYLTSFTDWSLSNYTLRNMVYLGSPNYNGRTTLGQTFGLLNQSDPSTFHATFPANTVSAIQNALKNGIWDTPTDLSAFVNKGGKLFLYHGLNDPLLSANNTIKYFEDVAAVQGGYQKLGENARLFLAPGMEHCAGGSGPNALVNQYNAPGFFINPPVPFDPQHDALAAIDSWVQDNSPPNSIIATKFVNDDATQGIARTMPLCPFPAKAHYSGSGSVTDAANWSCSTDDMSMLTSGASGQAAGL
ncbi:tannase/feruloyl esterase family alpha/beta hydrolase [Burkholderia ubonensis]|uniref:tannase/feruloyl esterase family alpha/beta hydrolase n=1 Tax=Burkholderia ubonensis TaxID=101571 RepID=UPI000A5B19E8|nr:tannase/feruloyl esterase family alpha/beta hydrolase [Burkholderia ubonensis]